jgi:hypothetical protein
MTLIVERDSKNPYQTYQKIDKNECPFKSKFSRFQLLQMAD